MKRIKLFEAFTSKGKITKANTFLYHWGLKKYIEEKELKTILSTNMVNEYTTKKMYRFAIYGPPLEIEYFSNGEITIFSSVIDWFYNKRIIASKIGYGRNRRLPEPLVDAVKKMFEDEKNKNI